MRSILAGLAAVVMVAGFVQTAPKPCHPAWKCQPAPTWTPLPTTPKALLDKNFADGTLAPFRVATFPDDHIGQPGQDWTVYNRFSNAHVTIHDGYADLRATKRTDGLWDAVLLETSQDGVGLTFGYGRFEFTTKANVGHATWQGMWMADTTTWGVTELDWEVLEGGQVSAHVHGVGAGGWYGAPPADWATVAHVFYIDRRPGYVAFGWDGAEKWRSTAAMPSTPLAVMLDTKVGFPWAEGPDATTPDPTWLQAFSVRVIQ